MTARRLRFVYRRGYGDAHIERALRREPMLEALRHLRRDGIAKVKKLWLADPWLGQEFAAELNELLAPPTRRPRNHDREYKRLAIKSCRYSAAKLRARNGGVLPHGTYRRLATAYMDADHDADDLHEFEVVKMTETEQEQWRADMLTGIVWVLQHGDRRPTKGKTHRNRPIRHD